MPFSVFSRLSDSRFIDSVWNSHSERGGQFMSVAVNQWGLVFTRIAGKLSIFVRGPETVATTADCPPEGEWMGVQFKLGVYLPEMPILRLVDNEIALPVARSNSFWLNGQTYEMPTFENAETFVERLNRSGALFEDRVVQSSLRGEAIAVTERTKRRRFLDATGMTFGQITQIERAQHATKLLSSGVSILDAVAQAGYADQPHLTRSLRRFIGQTPLQLLQAHKAMPLSLVRPADAQSDFAG